VSATSATSARKPEAAEAAPSTAGGSAAREVRIDIDADAGDQGLTLAHFRVQL
jgi:hypothetical protein